MLQAVPPVAPKAQRAQAPPVRFAGGRRPLLCRPHRRVPVTTDATPPLFARVRRWLAAADPGTDEDLVRRFAATRDEAAFAALVSRHGPMVLGVARRVVSEHHAAEDVAHATF